ncbi:DUF4116 domain-containing protein [Burkholderia cenocepacia]|uniref:DUF4116 domain-containing protein n=1 Tax=Burkholderia cenocepacia TaxID=95486 RepID=A0A1V2VTU6_9BURK|nr:DUF4116 domain-containing protein [Burkholderia cenocepacia]ONU47772.1 hypothetical protein A8E62_32150 [Burkholderia cenocepacia]ONU66263.1 hypothetical protein A8E68_07255 [Burkholderia cenocepacia]ONU76311.1 hypothetical protein A8E72_33920 [Burkholderia cenocepacia]ONU79522.1 hypothetical protein A8E73_22245 [Burkholderia cenocepacia]ONU89013.1 hypothetical protein A8E63_13900 [Burkholderia cenocepacia]
MNREEALDAAKKNGWFFLDYAKEFRGDKEVMIEAVKNDHSIITKAHKKLRKDKDFMMAAVQSSGWNIQYASDELKKDRELTLAALKQNPWAIREIDPSFYSDKEIVMLSVSQEGDMLQFASDELKNDREVVMKAVQHNSMNSYQDAYKYASEELKCDKEIIRLHLGHGGNFHLIPMEVLDEVRKDKDIAERALIHSEYNYTRFDSSLYEDKELIKRIAEINGSILSKITHFNDDKEVIMAGLNFRGVSLSYASERLRNDPELVLKAVKASYSAGAYVGDSLYEQLKSVTPHEMERKESIVHDAIPYLEQMVEAKNRHDHLDDTLAKKPLTKAQKLSDDIEAEYFAYKTPTTKTSRAKL